MRRHFYLVVDARDEDKIGGVDIREQRYEAARKNEQRTIQKRDLDTNEQFTETVVSLGYHDFADEQDYIDRNWLVTLEKLADIDTEHLEAAGLEPEMVERKLAQQREEDQEVATDGGTTVSESDSPTLLTDAWIESNTEVPANQRSAVESAFVTREQLLDALEHGEDLTARDGIGPKTADALWGYFRNVYGGEVEPDGTLVLTDEGLEVPDWLDGFVGTFTMSTPNITGRFKTTDQGMSGPRTTSLVMSPPNEGTYNERLPAGHIALTARGRPEYIYEIDDQREEVDGGEDA
jgi:hypothetical protein